MSVKVADGFIEFGEQVWYVGTDWTGELDIYDTIIVKVYKDPIYGDLVNKIIRYSEGGQTDVSGIEIKELATKYFKDREKAELYYMAELMTK